MSYGHGKTRIDLNGPYGNSVSLFKIADHWANLCGHNRIHVALDITKNITAEERYEVFATLFGDYSTLYYGEGKSVEKDPFAAWPFETKRSAEPYYPRYAMPSDLSAFLPHKDAFVRDKCPCIKCNVEKAEEVRAWLEEWKEFEDEAVEYLFELYVKRISE